MDAVLPLSWSGGGCSPDAVIMLSFRCARSPRGHIVSTNVFFDIWFDWDFAQRHRSTAKVAAHMGIDRTGTRPGACSVYGNRSYRNATGCVSAVACRAPWYVYVVIHVMRSCAEASCLRVAWRAYARPSSYRTRPPRTLVRTPFRAPPRGPRVACR